MVFTHDTSQALLAAAELVNTLDDPGALADVDDLDEFCTRFGYSGRFDGNAAELEAVRSVRPVLRDLLTRDRDDAALLVNDLLAREAALPRLVRHDGLDWHVHAVSDDAPLAVRVVVETAMAVLDVVRADETSRLAVCADETCRGIVVDLSRNRSKKFCSTTCGNRNAVSAFRSRRRLG
ncbi:putative RNA-binding Zn ribbon-like protein [Kineococcus radiotolerans]|uniref:Putative RNA-binding Zn ribbon-like protein n=1 Tax=Kineococcus radiotolerans TaxID=131568 RepID=A0A7W4TMM2_KINRA|nr:CGNR zinc finger domain-containing protein [Kineococcus radiotolerans]MBB2901272.1 putative RNA-binding Zn ribbon-like protein [Kineococcus radiotolerans]